MRRPSPQEKTTVLTSVKGTRAARGGSAALDPGCAPWSEKMWAMGERGLRRGLRTPGEERQTGPGSEMTDEDRHDRSNRVNTMRQEATASRLAPLDCAASRRSTVMRALPRLVEVIREYQSDSSSKRPVSPVFSSPRPTNDSRNHHLST